MGYAVAGLIGYLLGSVMFAVILSRVFRGVDIYTVGSGNPGFTNVFRGVDRGIGVATLVGDIGKGALATALGMGMLARSFHVEPILLGLTAGCGAILGHTFPIFFRFRGGKAVATAAGVFGVLLPAATGVAVLAWAVVLILFRYMSVASLAAAIVFPLYITFVDRPDAATGVLISAAWILAAVIVLRHRENLVRLRRGEENRFNVKRN